MQIEVIPNNPNCRESDQFMFCELESPRAIRGLMVSIEGKETPCDVVGVEADGSWSQAWATKVTDSGAGFAFFIHGGAWGIRIRSTVYAYEPWDFTNTHQWGEAFKIYGSQEDILYA